MYAIGRFFAPVILLPLFTLLLIREVGIGVVLALNETTLRWHAMKRDWHPSTRRQSHVHHEV